MDGSAVVPGVGHFLVKPGFMSALWSNCIYTWDYIHPGHVSGPLRTEWDNMHLKDIL